MRSLSAIAVALSIASIVSPAIVTQSVGAQSLGGGVLADQKSDQTLSKSYIGAQVMARSAGGPESIGKVSELILDANGKIVGVVVDVGGFLGVGAKPVGLAWNSLTEEQSKDGLLLKTSLTRQDFEAAPEYLTLDQKQVEVDRQKMKATAPSTAPSVQ